MRPCLVAVVSVLAFCVGSLHATSAAAGLRVAAVGRRWDAFVRSIPASRPPTRVRLGDRSALFDPNFGAPTPGVLPEPTARERPSLSATARAASDLAEVQHVGDARSFVSHAGKTWDSFVAAPRASPSPHDGAVVYLAPEEFDVGALGPADTSGHTAYAVACGGAPAEVANTSRVPVLITGLGAEDEILTSSYGTCRDASAICRIEAPPGPLDLEQQRTVKLPWRRGHYGPHDTYRQHRTVTVDVPRSGLAVALRPMHSIGYSIGGVTLGLLGAGIAPVAAYFLIDHDSVTPGFRIATPILAGALLVSGAALFAYPRLDPAASTRPLPVRFALGATPTPGGASATLQVSF